MKKKKPEVFYRPIDGSAPLSIYWYEGPKGDAVEANNEDGVGFFGTSGELLGVIFDDVSEKKDDQFLEFLNSRVEISVKNGKVFFKLIKKLENLGTKPNKRTARSSSKKRAEDAA